MNKALRPLAACLLATLALAFTGEVRAQSYGLTSRPTVGACFGNAFPPTTAAVPRAVREGLV